MLVDGSAVLVGYVVGWWGSELVHLQLVLVEWGLGWGLVVGVQELLVVVGQVQGLLAVAPCPCCAASRSG